MVQELCTDKNNQKIKNSFKINFTYYRKIIAEQIIKMIDEDSLN